MLTQKYYNLFVELLKDNSTHEVVHYRKSSSLWEKINQLVSKRINDCPYIIHSYIKAKACEKLKQLK